MDRSEYISKKYRCKDDKCHHTTGVAQTVRIQNRHTKLAVYVHGGPISMVLSETPKGKNWRGAMFECFLDDGINVKCLCLKNCNWYKGFKGWLYFNQSRVYRMNSREPEILALLVVEYHHETSLKLLANAQLAVYGTMEWELSALAKKATFLTGVPTSKYVPHATVSLAQAKTLRINLIGLNWGVCSILPRHSGWDVLSRDVPLDQETWDDVLNASADRSKFTPEFEKYSQFWIDFEFFRTPEGRRKGLKAKSQLSLEKRRLYDKVRFVLYKDHDSQEFYWRIQD